MSGRANDPNCMRVSPKRGESYKRKNSRQFARFSQDNVRGRAWLDRAKGQRRKTTHRIAQYMYTASQIPATNRDSW
jgi:hypothetical protein